MKNKINKINKNLKIWKSIQKPKNENIEFRLDSSQEFKQK